MRPSRRANDQMRAVSFERGVLRHAEGSCLVKFGDTHVLVAATLEERLPPWLKGQGRGWVTAEAPCSAEALAGAICRCGRALRAALTAGSAGSISAAPSPS